MRSTIQEETSSGKEAFERWAATFGVEIHKDHAYNVRFSEQTFKSAIEGSNKKIPFCGVR